jgi:RNA polymerase sigma-70 factor (ECF subfamily)
MEPTTAAARPEFRAIFREHAPYVWRVLRRLGVAESDVEDVAQEVFLVVHRRLAEFEGRSRLRTWIYGICLRTASDHRRRAHVRRELATDRPPERVGSAPQPRELEQRQARAILDGALERLGDDKRAVFVLFEIEELTMKEVAEAIGCPLQTAYSRLHAARRDLRDALATVRDELRGGAR